jgi:hypothetical protein
MPSRVAPARGLPVASLSRPHEPNRSVSTRSTASAGDHATSGKRPSSAPGSKQNLQNPVDDAGAVENGVGATSPERGSRPAPVKPLLLRSKSEYGLRHDEPNNAELSDEEPQVEWGARHGFEDHYQSEDIISQLANVSGILLGFFLRVRLYRSPPDGVRQG